MVDFAGWEMPVSYSGVLEEHRAVRTAAGLFDVSHMGEIRVTGPGAEGFLQRMTPNDVGGLVPGRAHYSGLLTERGTYVDDLLVYRLAPDEFLLVVNAANAATDLAWLERHRNGAGDGEVEIEDVGESYALLALQGPRAATVLQGVTPLELKELRYYRFAPGEIGGHPALVSRTGYTGEDGFELYLAPEVAPVVWDRVLDAGRELGLRPAGLGARDTLRLEAAMALYGNELDRATTPFEAGLDWVVKLGKGEFLGRAALVAQREAGLERRLTGLEIVGKGIARHGYKVLADGRQVGAVTSGSWSPTLERGVALAYLPPRLGEPGTTLTVEARGRQLEAWVVRLPFYRRPAAEKE